MVNMLSMPNGLAIQIMQSHLRSVEFKARTNCIYLCAMSFENILNHLRLYPTQDDLFIYWGFTPLSTLFQFYHSDSSLIHDPWVNKPVLG